MIVRNSKGRKKRDKTKERKHQALIQKKPYTINTIPLQAREEGRKRRTPNEQNLTNSKQSLITWTSPLPSIFAHRFCLVIVSKNIDFFFFFF